jgi:hypothetical protein
MLLVRAEQTLYLATRARVTNRPFRYYFGGAPNSLRHHPLSEHILQGIFLENKSRTDVGRMRASFSFVGGKAEYFSRCQEINS